jgi:hypothetical protein
MDNLVSCAMLLQHTKTLPHLSLIGRVYDFREFMESKSELQYPTKNPNVDLHKTMENHTHDVIEFRKRLPFEFSFDNVSISDIVE